MVRQAAPKKSGVKPPHSKLHAQIDIMMK